MNSDRTHLGIEPHLFIYSLMQQIPESSLGTETILLFFSPKISVLINFHSNRHRANKQSK